MKDFSWALARLLAMNGAVVNVTVAGSDETPPFAAAFAGILHAGQALDAEAEAEQDEAVVLRINHVLDGAHVGVIFIDRAQFRSADLDDGVLSLTLGTVTLCVETV